jgi:hypothetical protein
MLYSLNDLLIKMGAPEVRERGAIHWHYFNKDQSDIAGFAEIKLIEKGMHLIAELKNICHDYEDDAGHRHPVYTESFYLHAENIGGKYNVTKISIDDGDFVHPEKSVIELGLSLFHARALNISILMVEQSFNKQDMFVPATGEPSQLKIVPLALKSAFKKQAWGMVVPFRSRQEAVQITL